MAKRRNSPALFELLRDQSAGTSGVGLHTEAQAKPAGTPPPAGPAPQPASASAPAAPAAEATAAVAEPPEREAEPLSDAPELDITTPRFVAQPVRVRPGEPEMPDLSGLEPEPMVSRTDDGRVSFSLPVGTLAGIVGAAVIVLVIFGTSLYSLGGRDSKQELQPILGEEANRAIAGSEPAQVREPSVREPVRDEPDPGTDERLALTPEIDTPPPVVDDPPAETEEAIAADSEPARPANVDTRQAGLNYMYTSMTFDREEALGAQAFLAENGVDSIIEELERRSDGRTMYRLWTLVGLPGEGFQSSREKSDHERAIFDLGNEWLTEHGGRLDFSRPGQIGWVKFGG